MITISIKRYPRDINVTSVNIPIELLDCCSELSSSSIGLDRSTWNKFRKIKWILKVQIIIFSIEVWADCDFGLLKCLLRHHAQLLDFFDDLAMVGAIV